MMKTKLSRLLAVMLASVLVVTVCSIPALGGQADGVANQIKFKDAQSVAKVLGLKNNDDAMITINGTSYLFKVTSNNYL